MEKNPLVIFVAGTSYSGTTFFHMILGNDPHGMALGEIRWLFDPNHPRHLKMRCTCDDANCDLWRKFRINGESRLFESALGSRAGLRFVVDSSKNPFWIARHTKLLSQQGIATKHVLIWKSPQEFYASMKRRGRTTGWDTDWLDYHRLYFKLIQDWRAVPYAALVSDPRVLQATCEWLGIPHWEEKTRYWEQVQHIFGGNQTSRFHLYADEKSKTELRHTFDENRGHQHRRIYYSTPEAQSISLNSLLQERRADELHAMSEVLASHDVRAVTVKSDLPRIGQIAYTEAAVKFHVKRCLAYLKFGWRRRAY